MARKPDVQYIRFVTDGSAARVAEPVKPVTKTRLPKVRKKKALVLHIDLLAAVGVLLSVVMLVLMVVSCFQLKHYQQQANAMDDYVDYLKSENARLSYLYEQNVDLQAIEETALAMGLVPMDQVERITVSVENSQQQAQQNPGFGQLAAAAH